MQNRRWRVLIVDDEFRIGMLVKKLIRWDEYNLECIGCVDNGETAFEVVQSDVKPDVVITDIRMPKMNGLDLIEETRKLYKDMKFIVVSGYKEFEYAHRALQYGVEDYLLKPVNEEELNRILKKISEELEDKFQLQAERKKLQEAVSESRHIIKRDFLKNIIETEDYAEPENPRVSLGGEVYRGIDIKLDYVDYHKFDRKQDRLTVSRIVEIVEGILKAQTEEVLICEKENLHIYCLFNYDYNRSKKIKNSISEILSGIKDYLMGFEQYEVTIGIGMERTEFVEIRFSIKEAYRAVGNRIKYGVGRLIYADDVLPESNGSVPLLTDEQKESLRTSISSYSKENLKLCVNQIYSNYMLEEQADFSKCYDTAEEIVLYFIENMELNQEEAKKIRKQFLANCQHCYTITSLKKLLRTELGEYLEASREAAAAESAKPIRQAQQFIDVHYAEKIVLEDLAEVVGLNPVYFSVLFKKETGINFSAYLVNVRMEKAKELICTTNETIAAIGDRVGYKDSRYFSQTFTKQVGVKPALYRKLHS